MPFIDTKLNISLSREKEEALKSGLGNLISIFPGKSEYWLMLNFTDNSRLWFRGYDNFPAAMVSVSLFGGVDDDACRKMTAAVCDLFQKELGIQPDHVYIKYQSVSQWGWDGENF